MAQNYLQDRSWADANWSTGTNPAANGEAYIPESLATDVDQDLDEGTIDLNLLWISPGFKHNIGASSNELKIAADLVVHNGTGELHYDCSLGAGSALITDEMRIMCANNTGKAFLDSEESDLGTWGKLVVARGEVVCAGTMKWAAGAIVEVGFIDDPLTDASLTMQSNANTLAIYNQKAGKTDSTCTITRADVCGGTLLQKDKLITTLHVSGGPNGSGLVIYKHTALTTANVWAGGVLDLTQFYSDDLTVTTLNLWPGGTVYGQFDHGGAQVHGPVTVTTLNNMGGRILPYNPNLGVR